MGMFRPKTLAAGALTVLVAAASAAHAEADAVGTVDRVQNRVTAEAAGTLRELAVADPLFLGDLLQAHEAARLEATLADDTRITLGETAQLRVDEFLYAPGVPGGRLALRVLNGAFLFVGGRIEAPEGGNVEIATTFATLGVRGTTVWGGPLDGAFAVFVQEGEVRVTNAGQTVTLGPGDGTTIADPASPPQAPVVWGQDKIDRAFATISFQ